LPKRSNQLGNGKGQRSRPSRVGYVGQGYLPLGQVRASRLTHRDLQPICIGQTRIDLDLHKQGGHPWRGAIGNREHATVEPPTSKLDP
jgi:hypothetical protein